MLTSCPNCNNKISDQADQCPKCHFHTQSSGTKPCKTCGTMLVVKNHSYVQTYSTIQDGTSETSHMSVYKACTECGDPKPFVSLEVKVHIVTRIIIFIVGIAIFTYFIYLISIANKPPK